MPKVSVVIPAYNAMTYLPETLESVLKQTFNDFEVIVVNDGSTDETEQWISQVKDPKVRLISQKNQGLAGARNTGITHAQGEYIAILDADDLWEPDKLEKQVRVLDENPEVALVYTWVGFIDENGNHTGRLFKNRAEGDVWEELTQHNIVECGSVPLIRRSCFDTVGLFDRNLGSYLEDWDMWLRIAANHQFKVIQEPLVYYRQLSSSASRNWEAMDRSFQMVIEKAFSNAKPELMYLKNQSYGRTSLVLAWKALQSQTKDYQTAAKFRKRAISYYPQLLFSKEFVRLSVAIAMMRWLGADGYKKFLNVIYYIRRLTLAS